MACSEDDEVINLDESTPPDGRFTPRGVRLRASTDNNSDGGVHDAKAGGKPHRVKIFVPETNVTSAGKLDKQKEGEVPGLLEDVEDGKKASLQKTQGVNKRKPKSQSDRLNSREAVPRNETPSPVQVEQQTKATQTPNCHRKKELKEKMIYKMKEKELNQQLAELRNELAMCQQKLAKEVRNFERHEVKMLLMAEKVDFENGVITQGKGLSPNQISGFENENRELRKRLEQSVTENAKMKSHLDDIMTRSNAMQMEVPKPFRQESGVEAAREGEANKLDGNGDSTFQSTRRIFGGGHGQDEKDFKGKGVLHRREQELLTRLSFLSKDDDEISLGEFSPCFDDTNVYGETTGYGISPGKQNVYPSYANDDRVIREKSLGALACSDSKSNLVKIKKGIFRKKERYKRVHKTVDDKRGILRFIRDWKMKGRARESKGPDVTGDKGEGTGTKSDVISVASNKSVLSCSYKDLCDEPMSQVQRSTEGNENMMQRGEKKHLRIAKKREPKENAKLEDGKQETKVKTGVEKEDKKRKGLLNSLRGCFGVKKNRINNSNSESYGAKDENQNAENMRRLNLLYEKNGPKVYNGWVYCAGSEEDVTAKASGNSVVSADAFTPKGNCQLSYVSPRQGEEGQQGQSKAERELQFKRTIAQLKEENARLRASTLRNQQQRITEAWSSNHTAIYRNDLEVANRKIEKLGDDLQEATFIAEEANADAKASKDKEDKAVAEKEQYRQKYEEIAEAHAKLQDEMDVFLKEEEEKALLFEQKVHTVAKYQQQIKEGEWLRSELQMKFEQDAKRMQEELDEYKQKCVESELLLESIKQDKTVAIEMLEEKLSEKTLEAEHLEKELKEMKINEVALKEEILVKESKLEDHEHELEEVKANFNELEVKEQALRDIVKLKSNVANALIDELVHVKEVNADLLASKMALEEEVRELKMKDIARKCYELAEPRSRVSIEANVQVQGTNGFEGNERKTVGSEREAKDRDRIYQVNFSSGNRAASSQQEGLKSGGAKEDAHVMFHWNRESKELLNESSESRVLSVDQGSAISVFQREDVSGYGDHEGSKSGRADEEHLKHGQSFSDKENIQRRSTGDASKKQVNFAVSKGKREKGVVQTRLSTPPTSMARGADDPLSAESLLKCCLSTTRVACDKESIKKELCIERSPSITLEEGEVVGYPKDRCKQSRTKPERYVDMVLTPTELAVKYDPAFSRYEQLPSIPKKEAK